MCYNEDVEKVKNSVKNRVRPQNKHLKPFKRGEVANPTGRPLGQRNYATIYREALIKLGESEGKTPEELENELVKSGLKNAIKDYRFYKDTLDRIHGQATEKKELSGTLRIEGNKIAFEEYDSNSKGE